jgi:NADPH-dependent curcumin reductase CurA
MPYEWHFLKHPEGMPSRDHVALREVASRPLQDGEIRVANAYLSVDPYMRGRMSTQKSYIEGFALNEAMTGGAVGEVVESKVAGFAVGDKIMHMQGWRDEAIIDVEAATALGRLQKLPELGVPIQTFLHNLGLTGATAYFGLLKVAEAKPGETVFVSAAAGAVGSAVVQIAREKGMRVIVSAGGADKCAWVRDRGAAACIDYKAGPVLPQLQATASDGIDVYFDNVGGDHLDAALACANDHARFAICGMIDEYNDADRGFEYRHMIRALLGRVRIEGFLFTEFAAQMPEYLEEIGPLVAGGKIVVRETVHDGIEAAFDAFLGLYSGSNTGKMLVRI